MTGHQTYYSIVIACLLFLYALGSCVEKAEPLVYVFDAARTTDAGNIRGTVEIDAY